jgi:hypothetical protein
MLILWCVDCVLVTCCRLLGCVDFLGFPGKNEYVILHILMINMLWGVSLYSYLPGVQSAGWLVVDSCVHKDRTEHNRSFCRTRWRNTDWLTDQVITKWPSVCREILVCADKMFWTPNRSAQWTLYNGYLSKRIEPSSLFRGSHSGCLRFGSGCNNNVELESCYEMTSCSCVDCPNSYLFSNDTQRDG